VIVGLDTGKLVFCRISLSQLMSQDGKGEGRWANIGVVLKLLQNRSGAWMFAERSEAWTLGEGPVSLALLLLLLLLLAM
jgi:hypothetical protein